MDADSSYGGSDTAQDSHSGHDNSSSLETTHNDVSTTMSNDVHDIDTQQQEPNNFYHKNEITLPVNYDETDFQDNKPIKQPHYLSTANLNINDTLEHHSNLEEMSKNYKSTNYLNESPKTRKKSDVGVDNPAFQEEEYKPEVKSTFDNNKPYNGDLNSSAILGLTSPNKNDEPLTEAVNLELINLKPVGKDVTGAYENGNNGMTSIPVKKESDAEIGNPYDEYFVPVNEHRKYMRGEKLYVTMDKRNKKKRNKCLCWGLCLCIVAAAVIIGILAAVGVIGNHGPHPAQEVSARHFGSSTNEPEVKAAGGIFGLPKDITQETTIPPQTQTQRFTPGPPVVTVSSMLPTTETSMIQVPRALESQLVIDNLQFTPALEDKNSTEYKKLAEALETELKNSLFSSDMLNYGAADIEVKVVDFTPGSVVVKYRITWVFKDGIHNAKDPIDEEMLKRKMRSMLDKNRSFMDTYHIVGNTVTAERILDLCKIENNGCEYNCSFDYQLADFICTCPEGKYLIQDKKSCVTESINEPETVDFSHIHFHEHNHDVTLKPSIEPEPSSEPEPTAEHDKNYHDHHYPETTPEPNAEPPSEPELTDGHDQNYHGHRYLETTSEPNAEPSPEPEPTSEPVAVPKVTEISYFTNIEHSTEPAAEPSASTEIKPTYKPEEVSHENYVNHHELMQAPEFNAEPTTEPHPEPTAEPNPEPDVEPNAEPTIEPNAVPTLEPKAEPSPQPTPEPTVKDNIEFTAEHFEHYTEPAEKPTAEPNVEHIIEPVAEPTAEPSVEHNTEPAREPAPEPAPEPAAEHNTEPLPEPTGQSIVEHNTEPVVEPTAEPIVKDSSESVAEHPVEHNTEPVAEPTAEPAVEQNTEPLTNPNLEPKVEHNTEVVAKIAAESTIEHNTEPLAEPTAEPTVEHITEPIAEPTSEPNFDHEGKIIHELVTESSSENKTESVTEPIAEPTAEPINRMETKTEITTEPIINHDIKLVHESFTEPTAEPPTEPQAEPTVIPVTQSSSHSVNTIVETSTKSDTEVHVSASSTEFTPESITMTPVASSTESISSIHTSPTTNDSAENGFRHNHLSDEIFAEEETTTIHQSKEILFSEVPKMTTTEKNENGPGEISPTTQMFNAEEKAEIPVTTTMISMAESVVNNIVTTTKSAIAETTIGEQNHDENLIPIQVNKQTQLLHVQNSTESSESNIVKIPLVLNNHTISLQAQNVEIHNQTTEPKIFEVTTQSSDMSKIFTEIHKVIDNQYENATEMLMGETTNNTHLNMAVVESTENTSAMDNMSPFLPEIDNDTFVNKLHLGEHVIPHIQNETHEEDITETSSPPRLDNDQMNVTNPHDPNPVDTSLKVVPLEGHENEVLEKIISTIPPTTDQESKQTETHIIPVVIHEEEIATTTVTAPKSSEDDKQNATVLHGVVENINETVPVQVENGTLMITSSTESTPVSIPIETTTKSLDDTVKTTLPSEIINNVHSNNYFDNLKEKHDLNNVDVEKENITSSEVAQPNNLNDLGTSTEDLIALETTTNNGVKVAENRNIVVEITTEAAKINETTESINFANNNQENSTKAEQTELNATANIENSENVQITTAIPAEIATMPPPNNKSLQYEVRETLSDVTTTERLFLITKATTESPIITKADYEDLSVVPLNSDEEDTSKMNEKRVAHDATFNQLESDANDRTNDISQEERSVSSSFHNNLNEIHSGSEHSDDSTTSKIDELDTNTEFVHEFIKYDDKPNKKNYLDKEKPKFEKKVKLEKVITALTNDEILTTSVPNDKESSPFSDIKPVTEDFTISGFSRCVFGQFQCANGTSVKDSSYCIPETDRCDSVDDCSDGSDEIDCVKDGCPNNFQCASGQCLKRHLVCDGIQNCNDGTDEVGCDQWNCRFDELSCGHGQRCLPIAWKCDSRAQCPDGSDEHNCPSTMCNEDSFHCLEQGTCVPNSWRCDGKSDCMNSEDERSCKCADDEFKCVTGGGCIKSEQRCDGIYQCADRSDEWNCLRLEEETNNKKYLEIEVSNNTWYPVCSENWNQTHSDLVCRGLGYGASSLTETINKPDGDFKAYLKLKPQLTYSSPILSEVEKTDTCDSFVSITCQDFTCGSHSTLDVQSARIIGGNRGAETQWPSLTLLYNKRRNLQCTATLVAPLWVIASHSCIFDANSRSPVSPNDWILYAGSTNFFSNLDNSTTQVGQVKRILAHPQAKFSQFEFSNDVVLVELSKPLSMTRNVSAVCLPDKDIEPRQLCVIAGWGVSKPGEPSKNQYLHYLPVPIIDSQECNSTKHYNGLMSQDKICAGYTDSEKTPCYNDEGAPLMCFSDSAGTWELQGVLSHHDNCARSKHPAIYTSINSKIRQWVINTIGQKPARSA